MSWKLTVRHSSEVERDRFESLDEALEQVRRKLEEIRSKGPLSAASGFRDYGPGEQVHARIEVTGPGLVRRPEAGVDVMGDGSLVPYRGSVRKQPLAASDEGEAVARLREVLG